MEAVRSSADLGDATPAIELTAADLAAIEGLRRLHANGSATTITATPAPVADDVTLDAIPGGRPADAPDGASCPIPGFMRAGATSCPVGFGEPSGPVERSRADLFVRRLLRIRDTPTDRTDAATYRAFRRSMTISAIRCTLTYVIFPFVLPGISFLNGAGPYVGVLIGSIALVCDTFAIRRFFAVDHRYRWYFSAVAFGIMCLLAVLLVQDIGHAASELLR